MTYYKHQHENWFQKGIRYTEGGLKVWGTAQGIYQVGKTIANLGNTAYQIGEAAAPALALL